MATARALALADETTNFRGDEQIEDSELVVTSARAQQLRAYLPALEDGTGATVDSTYRVRVQANAAGGSVEIVDVFGRRVCIVPQLEERVVSAKGNAANPIWSVSTPIDWSVGVAVTAAGSSTPALGTTGPAASGTVIWYSFQKLDGTLGYIATWS